jgi:hypothetical protein
MDTTLLESKFDSIGARLKASDRPSRRYRNTGGAISLDVQTDRKGEFFELVNPTSDRVEIAVIDLQPVDRHLLLLVRNNGEKEKFLCGHDERHWFVAAIPESAPVGTVRQAKEALKPKEVQSAQARKHLNGQARLRRKNSAFIRQGEWFFLPNPTITIDPKLVLKNEPLVRGNGGKPHWAEFCYPYGGELVYVCARYSTGVTPARYQQILSSNNKAKNWGWRAMRRNPAVYVRGRIRHPDHRTITLHGWHQVVMNTENEAKAMRHVAFLD